MSDEPYPRQPSPPACYYCGLELDGKLYEERPNVWRYATPTTDHVVPRAHGGTDDPANLVTACAACNSKKGVDSAAEFIARGLRSREEFRRSVECPTCAAPPGDRCRNLRSVAARPAVLIHADRGRALVGLA